VLSARNLVLSARKLVLSARKLVVSARKLVLSARNLVLVFYDIYWCRDQDGRNSKSSALTKGTQSSFDKLRF
jgi:hypothetical protein